MSKRNSQAGKARRRAERQRQRAQAERTSMVAGDTAAAGSDPESLALTEDVPEGLAHILGQEHSSRAGPRRPRVLDVRLSRFWFPEDDENDVSWSAEWGLRDDPVGVEDRNEDLQQLVDDLIEDARRWTDRYDLAIEWDLSGDAPAGKTWKTWWPRPG
jgi:hypothetical protein